jgi:hypothetical protein
MGLYKRRAPGPQRTPRDPAWEALDLAPTPNPEYGYLRGLILREYVERAEREGLVSRRWVEERLRGPLAEPVAWSPSDKDGRGYASSSSQERS